MKDGFKEGEMEIQNLNEMQIKEAFERSGYTELDFLSHRFVKLNERGNAVYEISFYDDDGSDAIGSLYIEERDGKLYGEF